MKVQGEWNGVRFKKRLKSLLEDASFLAVENATKNHYYMLKVLGLHSVEKIFERGFSHLSIKVHMLV